MHDDKEINTEGEKSERKDKSRKLKRKQKEKSLKIYILSKAHAKR